MSKDKFYREFRRWLIARLTKRPFVPSCNHDRYCEYTALERCVSGVCNYHCPKYCGCGAEVLQQEEAEIWSDTIGGEEEDN